MAPLNDCNLDKKAFSLVRPAPGAPASSVFLSVINGNRKFDRNEVAAERPRSRDSAATPVARLRGHS